MSEQQTPEPSRTVVTREVLDAAKRQQILVVVANGSSRRVAARYVGCAPSTITRTAARDPEFAAALAHAEEQIEVESLQRVRQAAKKDRYWRAAAWLLERKNPEQFAPRDPAHYCKEQMLAIFAQVLASLTPQLPDGPRNQAMERLGTLLIDVESRGFTPEPKP